MGLTERIPDEAFQYMRHLEGRSMEFQLGMAKWVIATALLVNGGALVALMSAAKEFPEAAAQGGGFVVGVIFALLTGVLAWLSTAATNEAITDRIDWTNLSVQDPVSADRWDKVAKWFAIGGLIAVLISIGAFGAGAWRVQLSIATAVQKAGTANWWDGLE